MVPTQVKKQFTEFLTVCPRKDRLGVTHAISPISFKLSQYNRQPLSQSSIYNPRTQYFLLNLQALARYAGFWTS